MLPLYGEYIFSHKTNLNIWRHFVTQQTELNFPRVEAIQRVYNNGTTQILKSLLRACHNYALSNQA